MNDLFGGSDSVRIMVALFISRNAESMLNSTLVLPATGIQEFHEKAVTYHTLASDEIADPIGPAKLLSNVLVFTTLKSEGRVSNIHVPSCIKCKLN